jgi:competence protein ComEC
MIDCGPKTEHFDAGERVISPKLRALGIDRIDLPVLTHPDMDHIGGLAGISKRFSITKVLLPNYFTMHPAILEQLSASGMGKGDLISIVDHQRIRISDLTFQLFLPDWDSAFSDNEGSLVMQMFHKESPVAVFSGDLGSDGEIELVREMSNGSPILMAGHHGSSNSTSAAWLRDSHPKYVVISCGAGNIYGHPAAETLDRIGQSKAEILRTDRLGDIYFQVQNGRIERQR